ncbi:MAG: hypothetical protein ACI8Z1_001195 [Candidatus Azotimanducaceae bacterium]|jgi:hypothetical protein
MVYVIIGVAMLFIIVPIIAVLPNPRQKAQMRMRAAARARGVAVELTQIDDPVPVQEKYISPTGQAMPPILKTAAYRFPRKRPADRRSLTTVEWKGISGRNGWEWDWSNERVTSDFKVWLLGAVEKLPDDVELVMEESWIITVHWHEREEGTEEDVFEFLKECASKDAHQAAIDN